MRSSVRGKGCWGFSGDGDQRVEVGLGAARIWRGERRGAVLEAEREGRRGWIRVRFLGEDVGWMMGLACLSG